MEGLLLLPPILLVLFAYVYMTAKFAEREGYNFKVWLALSIFLPFISTFILLMLPSKPKSKSKAMDVS